MQQKRIVAVCGAAVAIVAILFCSLWVLLHPKGVGGEKTITVQIVYINGSSEQIKLTTDEEYLGGALKNEQLIDGEGGSYGIYLTTVKGVYADEDRQQYWAISREGKEVITGVDYTPIRDGDRFELTFKIW